MTAPKIPGDTRVTDLTVRQLQHLIRRTVQQAMTEVIVEMAAIHEMDEIEAVEYEAELTDYMQSALGITSASHNRKHDD